MASDLHQEAASAASAALASKFMYGGAAGGGLGFVLSNEFLGVAGLLVAVAGYLVNSHYKRKDHALRMAQDLREQALTELQRELRIAEDRRQQIEHEARMQALRGGGYE